MKKPSLSHRENFLRAAEFKYPEYIPARISVFWPLWNTYREKLEKIASQYSLLFPGFKPGSITYDEKTGIITIDEYRYDAFGCLWHFTVKGYQGQVVKHPLDDWSKFKDYEFPDPENGLPTESGPPIPWEKVFEGMEKAREEGRLVVAGMPHGFFFQRLYYLRGFNNLLKDFIRKPPQLYELIDKLVEYNLQLVKKLLTFKHIDLFSFGDDLGTQNRMPISPKTFREFIYPAYKKIFGLVKEKGILVRLHTDGHIVEVMDQLLESGVDILNIQDRVNGLENLVKIKGKVCIDLDIDRQKLIPYGTPTEIKYYIRELVRKLALKKGGLMFYAEVHPPTPLENIKALAEALEENIWLK